MTPTEIILLIIAIIVLVLSFVIVDRSGTSSSTKTSGTIDGVGAKLSEKDLKELKMQADKVLEACIADSVLEADDKMSKISNEKIMAVNDFSSQLLEKIEQNNEQVVFLYNMLTQREDEIKATYAKMDSIRRENKEFLEKLSFMMSEKSKHKQVTKKTEMPEYMASGVDRTANGQSAGNAVKNSGTNNDPATEAQSQSVNQQANGLKTDNKSNNSSNSSSNNNSNSGLNNSSNNSLKNSSNNSLKNSSNNSLNNSSNNNFLEYTVDDMENGSFFEQLQLGESAAMEEEKTNKNDQILALYKQKKSILDISRQLNLGQGEVKLVIDLYGR